MTTSSNTTAQQGDAVFAGPIMSPSPQHVQRSVSAEAAPPLTVSPNLTQKFHPVMEGVGGEENGASTNLFIPDLTNSTDELEQEERFFYEQEQPQEDGFTLYPRHSTEGLRAMVLDFGTHSHLMMASSSLQDCEQPSIILDNDTFSISDDESMGDCFSLDDEEEMGATPYPMFPELNDSQGVFRQTNEVADMAQWPALAPARRTGDLF
eukprot:CAMPEP_0172453384 /NCGR_PEP_ID=MMETSP1065-20121228/10731_1 /TAXON_ID=265537 /ORGANISM="Amphiprora paludosa, Strain CCMP125" /LENGTH=207 /DNA_ID=CAMNT_0013205563 /DNA_START=97 /DNA_END=720 /DNA_ORIENTATION=-